MGSKSGSRSTTAALPLVLLVAAGCGVVEVQSGPPLDPAARWALVPVMNLAEAPQAGERVEAQLETLLRARGVHNLQVYPPIENEGSLPELDERRRREKALDWARGRRFVYAVTGSVTEWRYKSGLDGEPAVGLSLQVSELDTGRVLWSASGARIGWGRSSLSGTSQELVHRLLENLVLRPPK